MTLLERSFGLLCALVLESGRRWGEAAVGWQRDDARAVLDPDAPERWHFLTRPRGGSKTTDLAGVAIALLVTQAPPRARLYAVATDSDQAGLLLDALSGFVARTPELQGVLTIETRRVIVNATGATLEVLPADAPSAWGLRPWAVIVDELAAWPATRGPRQLWDAVLSALPKVPGARLVLLTSAGDPGHWSARVLEAAKVSPRWRVHEQPGPVEWIDPEDLEEQQRLLIPSQYARLHLNEWTAPEDRLTTVADVRACMTPGETVIPPQPGYSYLISADLGVKADRSVVCVTSRIDIDDRTGVALDRIETWEPRPGARRRLKTELRAGPRRPLAQPRHLTQDPLARLAGLVGVAVHVEPAAQPGQPGAIPEILVELVAVERGDPRRPVDDLLKVGAQLFDGLLDQLTRPGAMRHRREVPVLERRARVATSPRRRWSALGSPRLRLAGHHGTSTETTRPRAIRCAHRPRAGHVHDHRAPCQPTWYTAPSPRQVASTFPRPTARTMSRPSAK